MFNGNIFNALKLTIHIRNYLIYNESLSEKMMAFVK